MSVTVYTDGACSFNGRADAIGGIGLYVVETDERYSFRSPITVGPGTNNRAELEAIIMAISYCISRKTNGIIVTDSMLSLNIITKWMDGWCARGWTKSSKGEIKNLETVKLVYMLLRQARELCLRIDFRWCQGHSGNEYNDIADALAVRGQTITKEPRRLTDWYSK